MTVSEAVFLVSFGDNDRPFQELENCIKCALTSVTGQFPNKTINIKENTPHRHRAFCIFSDELQT